MSFHPQKYTTIRVTRKKRPLETSYQLRGNTLEVVDGGKYLGIHISNDLSWREHIRQTTTKATRSLGFLGHNLHSYPQNVRAQAYTTLVRPVLKYASKVWDPHQIQQIQRLEQVQRQTARFATGNYYSREPGCVTNILKDLQWEPLRHRRVKGKIVMLYKIIHYEVEIPIHGLMVTNTRVTHGTQAASQQHQADQHPGGCVLILVPAINHHGVEQFTIDSPCSPLSDQLPAGHPDTGPCCVHQVLDRLFNCFLICTLRSYFSCSPACIGVLTIV